MLDLLKLYLHGAENIKNFIVKHLTFKAAFTATSHKTAGWLSMLETHLYFKMETAEDAIKSAMQKFTDIELHNHCFEFAKCRCLVFVYLKLFSGYL